MARGMILLLLLAGFAMAADPKAPKGKEDALPFGATKQFGSNRFAVHESASTFALRPDGKAYAEIANRDLIIFDATGKSILKAPAPEIGTERLVWSADAKQLLAVGVLGAAIHTASTGKITADFKSDDYITLLAATPDLKTVVVRKTDKQMKREVLIWLPGKPPQVLAGTESVANYWAAITPDGNRLALNPSSLPLVKDATREQIRENYDRQKTIELFDLTKNQRLEILTPSMKSLLMPPISFLPDGDTLLLRCDETLFTYRISDRETVRVFLTDPMPDVYRVRGALPSADGKSIFDFSMSELKVWDTATGKVTATLTKRQIPLGCSFIKAVAPTTGPPIALAKEFDRVRIIPLTGEKTTFPMTKEHAASVLALRASQDGQRLVSVGSDRLVIRWDTATGKAVTVLAFDGPEWKNFQWPSHMQGAVFAISPDLTKLATGAGVVAIAGAQPTIAFKLKDVNADDAVKGLGYTPEKWRFAWSANGKRLAAFWDRYGRKNSAHGVVVYDDTGKILFEDTVADGETSRQCDGDISPDGKRIVCRSNPTKAGKSMATLRVWDISLGKLIATRDWDDTADSRDAFAVFTGDAQGIYTTIGKSSYRIALSAFDAETKLEFPLTTYRAVAFSADRKTILVDHGSLYEETSGKFLRDIRPVTPEGHYQRTTSAVTFSPNGRSLYLAGHDGTILMYPYPQNK